MTTTIRVASMGRSRTADVLEERADGSARVRYHDTGRTAVVPSKKIVGRGKSDGRPKAASARARARTVAEKIAEVTAAVGASTGVPLVPASSLPAPTRGAPRAPLKAVPKPRGPARSPRYLAFVREHACAVCGRPGPSHAHHHGPRGMSQKTDDYRTLPLCVEDHAGYHDGNIRITDDEAAHWMRELLIEYVREAEGT